MKCFISSPVKLFLFDLKFSLRMFLLFLKRCWSYWTCLSFCPLKGNTWLEAKFIGKHVVCLAPLTLQVDSHMWHFTFWGAARLTAGLGLWQLSPVTLQQPSHLFLGEKAEPDVSPQAAPASPWGRFQGLAHVHFCSILHQGSSFWLSLGRCFLVPFLNQPLCHLCTIYVSVTEVHCAILFACFIPPTSCTRLWVTDIRQYKWIFHNCKKIQEATAKRVGCWIKLNEYTQVKG